MKTPLFRKEAIEGQVKPLTGNVLLTQPLSFSVIISVLVALVALALLVLANGQYSRKETVSGVLHPSKGIIKSYASISGRVELADISEGSVVEKGQLIGQIHTSDQPQPVLAQSSGRIANLMVNTIEQVQSDTLLFSIIPTDSPLQAILYVTSRAYGLIKPGQSVNLRYAAFPYQQFGHAQGRISQVATAALMPNEVGFGLRFAEPVYRVVVTLEQQQVGEHPLQSGMLLNADILLQTRSMIAWLFSPSSQ